MSSYNNKNLLQEHCHLGKHKHLSSPSFLIKLSILINFKDGFRKGKKIMSLKRDFNFKPETSGVHQRSTTIKTGLRSIRDFSQVAFLFKLFVYGLIRIYNIIHSPY